MDHSKAAKECAVDVLVAGTTAAAIRTIMAPVITKNLILQLDPFPKSAIDGVRRVGLKFWTKNIRNSAKYGLTIGIQFGIFHYWTRLSTLVFQNHQHSSQTKLSNFYAGAIAGSLSLPIVYPLARLHVPFKSTIGSAPGWARFMHYYDGFQEAVLPTVIHKALYFGLYETLKPIFIEDPKNSPIKTLMLATATSYTANVIAHPFEVIRQRTVMQDASIRPRGWQVARDIVVKEGLRGLTKGPIRFISALMGGMVLVGYDQMRQFW